MVQLCGEKSEKRGRRFSINDNQDVVAEVPKRLDDRSLVAAAGVCRLWRGLARSKALWEYLCFRQLALPPDGVRALVAALGGYRRLYTACVRPLLISRRQRRERSAWTPNEAELSLAVLLLRRLLPAIAAGRSAAACYSDADP
ncbi:F-box protein SNE [Striga hermonthica]|uniref:F-box protein SNE n=1 Tax=Striga hermonthica TaxID=68872 RepID=A0A9N7R1D1_STRHE|nr:F-box protein SNE [Striga hermonthica]